MQNGTSRQQKLPNAQMTYSVASSLYPDTERLSTLPNYATPMPFPSPEILLGGYTSNGSSIRQRETRQMTPKRSPSFSDPIQTHLLVETALGDCQNYDVLSFEELEILKKEDVLLRKRIEGLRRRLALETKVRDAAKSLSRLHSQPSSASSSPKLGRRGSLFSTKSTLDKADSELASAMKNCDELSRELYSMEQRSREAQMKILQHTARILQVTHRGVAKTPNDVPFIPGGRPESPASLDGFNFNDRGLQNGARDLDLDFGFDKPRKRSSRGNSRAAAMQQEALFSVAKRLEGLNDQMRQTIAQSNPDKAQGYRQLPQANLDTVDEVAVSEQLQVLSEGLEDLKIEQDYIRQESQTRSGNRQEVEILQKDKAELQAELQASLQENIAMEDRVSDSLGDVNTQLYELLNSISTSKNAANLPPIPYDEGPAALIQYTNDRLTTIKFLVQASAANAEKNNQTDAVLQGLWQFILGAEEDLRDRKRAERQQVDARRASGEELDSDDELSPDEDDGLPEEFSLQSFNTKVQWLVSRSSYLKEKESSLRRKVKQHRAVATNATRSMSVAPATSELQAQLERTNEQHAAAREELADVSSRFAQLRSLHEEKSARIQSLEEELENAAQEARDEARLAVAELEGKSASSEQRATSLEEKLTATLQEREEERRSHLDQEHVFRKTEAELRELEGEVVRLTTELTITKAELDAAYGSRSQRQADAAKAANTEAAKRLDEVTAELEVLRAAQKGGSVNEEGLKKELSDTLKEFEELTKASVEAERERDELEVQIDQLRDKTMELENRLAEEQVKWLGIMQPTEGSGAPPPTQSTSALVLKNEFKKMMRETRSEHLKVLRAEQDERRRLEALVRTLKKGGSGKSSLSYSMTA